jgi:bidirectional [NiFe] hydrogenase diaphorase subunit
MAIAAYAVGAQQGFIYVRGEYGLPSSACKQPSTGRARASARQPHLRIRTQFRVDIRSGPERSSAARETALLASIEAAAGNRGSVRRTRPKPVVGRPTLINNVETFANIPPIINNGSKWFSSSDATSKAPRFRAGRKD